ncbi:NAD-dependent epimerase/dehydratase family protein [Streptomyces sp. NPDC056061]|uniref:NAD-dependent epimerase/dehydratase family protein n=1 Tax=Streptomyces sp. NPDC056061 TaxID=3345700 RepID=UPI0035D880ED
MRIIVAGADGYLGWPMCMRLAAHGHDVLAVDSLIKRAWESELSVRPVAPVSGLIDRARIWRQMSGRTISVEIGDLCVSGFLDDLISNFEPDVLIDFAEQPSAPMSMMDEEHGVQTQVNNVVGTLRILFALRRHAPQCHLVKLGTMGEYGTPNIDIEEGFLEVAHNGRRDVLPFPKQPGSIYHLSKVHDSHNIAFACNAWGLRASDLNQGIVYGMWTEQTRLCPELQTSFHYDPVFGTVMNRFCVQALADQPLTVYGQGGQTRGFLNILDTLQSIETVIDHPPRAGEYRVFNQFAEQFSVRELAARVAAAAMQLGHTVTVLNVRNPRPEAEDHYYNAKHSALLRLGVQPHLLSDTVLVDLLRSIAPFVADVQLDALRPDTAWTSIDHTPPELQRVSATEET